MHARHRGSWNPYHRDLSQRLLTSIAPIDWHVISLLSSTAVSLLRYFADQLVRPVIIILNGILTGLRLRSATDTKTLRLIRTSITSEQRAARVLVLQEAKKLQAPSLEYQTSF